MVLAPDVATPAGAHRMAALEGPLMSSLPRDAYDHRSLLVLVEPIWGWGTNDPSWHGMAFAGGKVVNDITGSDRAVVAQDCWDALDEAGVATSVWTDEDYDRTDGHP